VPFRDLRFKKHTSLITDTSEKNKGFASPDLT